GPLLGQPDQPGLLAKFLEPIFTRNPFMINEPSFAIGGIDGLLLVISIAVAFAGMLAAWRLFGVEIGPITGHGRPAVVQALTRRLSFLYRGSANKWWFDDINNLLFVVIGGRFANALAWFDKNVVDGIVNAIGSVTRRSGAGLARVQTGRVQNYAL